MNRHRAAEHGEGELADADFVALDLSDIVVDAVGEEGGITISIAARDPALVPELQRRVAHDLETAARLRPRP